VSQIAPERGYPGIAFRPRSRNWWARLTRVPAECVHLETEFEWMAAYAPDTIYLRGKNRAHREPARPEVSLCRACLLELLEPELAGFPGRVAAFEPDAGKFSQYFFIASVDFESAGLKPEVSEAMEQRLRGLSGSCEHGDCARRASWLWMSREEVPSLDEFENIRAAPGRRLCARHGAAELCGHFMAIPEANLFYVNVPYGERGAYVWI
jgi:hypothetical protein